MSWLRLAVVVVVVVTSGVAAGGCGAKRGADPELGKRVQACAAALDASETLPPGERATALARGCPYACPGLSAWADAVETSRSPANTSEVPDPAVLIAQCNLSCSEAATAQIAEVPVADRLSALVAACGGERYGLRASEAAFVTADWLVLREVNAWLERARSGTAADQVAQQALERAELRATFLLPLPDRLAGHYTLSIARHPRPSNAAFYVIVTGGEVRTAAVPVARLRGRELERRPMPGGEFPGQLLTAGSAGKSYADLVAMLATQRKTALAATDRAPLVLADGTLPVARLFDVLTELGEPAARLGVRALGAYAHRVALERATVETEAAPVLAVRDGDFAILGFGDDRTATAETLADELRHFAAMHAPVRKLTLQSHPRLTVGELTMILDAAADAKVSALVFTPTLGDVRGGDGGAAAPEPP